MSLCSLQPSDNPKACKTIGNAQRLQSLCHSFRSNYQKLGAFARHERRKWRRAPSKACALFVISGSDVHRDVQRGDIWIVGEEGGTGGEEGGTGGEAEYTLNVCYANFSTH